MPPALASLPRRLTQFSAKPALRIAVRQTRSVHLAPPFLLDSYIPRYHLLSSADVSKKRSLAHSHLANCNLCPRLCGVNRYEKTGHCLIGAEKVKVNVIAPHFGEEPCIQGWNGSGSVFFSGCNLRCVFCQNHVCRLELWRGFILLGSGVFVWLT